IVYTTTHSSDVTSIGLPPGMTGVYSSGTYTISGSSTTAGVYNYTVTPVGICATPSLSGTITVNSGATIDLDSGSQNSQTLCVNNAISTISYTIGSGATGVSASGLPTGVSGVLSGNTYTISGTPSLSGVYNYTLSTVGGCGVATQSGTITVNPDATITHSTGSTAQIVCINTAIANIEYTLTNVDATGATVSGLPAGVNGLYDATLNTFTISGTPIVSGVFPYTVTSSGLCATPLLSGTLTVDPDVTLTLNIAGTDTQSLCVNSTSFTPISYTLANGATGVNSSGLPSGINGILSGTTYTLSGVPTLAGVYNYTLTTVGGCSTATQSGTITVNPDATITHSTGSTAQIVCINTAIANIEYALSNVDAIGATVSGLPAGVNGLYDATLNTFTISGTPIVSGVFPYTVTSSGLCATPSLSGTLTVDPDVTLTLNIAGTDTQTLCVNSTSFTPISYTLANGATGVNSSGLPSGINGILSGTTYTLSGVPTLAGVYNYTLTTVGGCSTASQSGTITVNPDATITHSTGSTAQIVCINTAIANIEYTLTNVDATGATVSGLPAGVNGLYDATLNTFTISGTPIVSGVFPYTVTSSGLCATPALSGTLTVNPDVTMTLSSLPTTTSQTLCVNTTLSDAIVYTLGNGATGVTAIDLPPGVNGVLSGNTYTITGTPSLAGVYNYTLTTVGGCSTASQGGTITVNPNVLMTLSSGIGSTNQSLCINTPINLIEYTLSNVDATGAIVSGLPSGLSGVYTGSTFQISGSPSVSGSFPYTITTSGSCSSLTLGGLIQVAPNDVITLSSTVGSDYPTLCENTALTPIVYNISDATGVSVTGLPAGVSGLLIGNTYTISGTPSADGSYPFTVSTTGGCLSAQLGGVITVNPSVTMVLSSLASTSGQSLCVNSALTPITYQIEHASATGATITGLPAGLITSYSATGEFRISGVPTASGLFTYTITTSGGCSSVSLQGTIDVIPQGTINLTSANSTQTVCVNTGISPIRYQITNSSGASVSGLPAGLSGVFNSGVYTISGSPSIAGTFTYTLTTAGGCSTAQTGTIVVSPDVTLSLSSSLNSTIQEICIGSSISNIQYALGNVDAAGAVVTGLPNGLSASYGSGVLTISGTPSVVGTYPYTVRTSGGCGSLTLGGSIKIKPNATITLDSSGGIATQTVCINSAIAPIRYLIGQGATTASITSGGLPTGVSATFFGGILTISGNALSAGVYNYVVSTTGGCGTATLSGVIRVNPNVVLTLGSAPQTSYQPACLNEQIDPIKYTTTNGATSVTVTGLPTGITGSFASGAFTITGAATQSGTFPYVVTTVGGCGVASLSGIITINPNVTIALDSGLSSDNQRLCVDTAITPITYLLGNGATGATLVSGSVPVGITGSYNPLNHIFTISGTAQEVGTFNYIISTTGGCSSATLTGRIVVDAKPVVRLPQDGFICVDELGNPISTYTLYTGMDSSLYSFEWSTTTGVISGANGPSYIATAPGVYSVKVTNNQTGCDDTAQALIAPSLPPSDILVYASSYFEDNQMVRVDVSPAGDYLYQLGTGAFQESNLFTYVLSGTYTITVKDKFGCGEKTAQVTIINFPKFFTPNGDGYNDTWNIFEISNQVDAKIYIFDRYGKLVKEIMPSGEGWDGTIDGTPVPATDYWFEVSYKENGVDRKF
ncbi:T9SS type B sorting domain-containing protein, partial [Flavobacterium sp. CYK-55]|uniref:T9SS type B sorting domain-containing protein n=1 Tax=Flavobacterium sp. CYK-55 TaxID=2835529 RepID=UPI001BD0A281